MSLGIQSSCSSLVLCYHLLLRCNSSLRWHVCVRCISSCVGSPASRCILANRFFLDFFEIGRNNTVERPFKTMVVTWTAEKVYFRPKFVPKKRPKLVSSTTPPPSFFRGEFLAGETRRVVTHTSSNREIYSTHSPSPSLPHCPPSFFNFPRPFFVF